MKLKRSVAKEERAFARVKRLRGPEKPKQPKPPEVGKKEEEKLPLKLAGGSGFVPSQWTFYHPGGSPWKGGIEGPNIGNVNNPLNPFQGDPGTRQSPISLAFGPGQNYLQGQLKWVGGPFGWGRYEDFGPGVKGAGDIAVKGRYKTLARTGYNPRLFRGGGGGGQGGGGLIGGGPFQGWTPEAMQQWHSGPGPGQLGYQSFTGQTAGPGGQALAYPTTSYLVPGYGWVPQAQMANPQASMNLFDYINPLPFGGSPTGPPGSGEPTRKAIGSIVGTASNLIVPGLGFLTKPLAMLVHKMIQGGASPKQIKAVVKEEQKAAGIPKGGAWRGGGGGAGGGFGPTGEAARGREWWSSDFGRSPGWGEMAPGGYNLAGPGGGFGQRGTGFGSGTVGNWATAIGFGGNLGGGGPVHSRPGGAGLSRPYTEAQYYGFGGGPQKYASPLLTETFGGVSQRPSYEQYLGMWNAPGTPGSSTGFGGAAYGGAGGIGGRKQQLSRHIGRTFAYQKGAEDVLALERGNYPITEEELRAVPEWLRDMLKTIPLAPTKGRESEQFRPQSVPVFHGPRGKFYDPRYSREDEMLLAKKGKKKVGAMPDTDTVPAMLTPREAVLNRNAAELAGRGNIEKLNQEGNELAEKGIDLAGGDKNMKTKPKKYQGGGGYVKEGPSKSKKQPEQLPGLGGGQPGQNVNQYGVPYGWNPPPTPGRDQGGGVLGQGGGVLGRGYGPDQGNVPPVGPTFFGGFGQRVNQWGNPYGWQRVPPEAGPVPMPAPRPDQGWGAYPMPAKLPPGSASFYPKPLGAQAGATDITQPIGVPPVGQQAYGPPVALSAGDVSKFQKAAQQAGLSQSQISGIMQAVQGMSGAAGAGGGAYDQLGGQYANFNISGGGNYQGGISDIGYPPFVGPNMEYHADKGSNWIGPYDPNFMIPHYQRGTASVSRYW
jgi:hypothetical protein